jgi:hypothetical protein
MVAINVPEEEIVVSLIIHAEHVGPDDLERFLSAFATTAVKAGLEQATIVEGDKYIGVAW